MASGYTHTIDRHSLRMRSCTHANAGCANMETTLWQVATYFDVDYDYNLPGLIEHNPPIKLKPGDKSAHLCGMCHGLWRR